MKSNVRRKINFVSLCVLFAGPTLAQNGGIPIRIANQPNARCIDGSRDQLWLTMYRVVISKEKGFLTKENRAQVVVNVSVDAQAGAAQQLSFPLSALVDIEKYPTGQVSLPIEYTLINGLSLSQTDGAQSVRYTAFGVKTTLVNLKTKSGLGRGLEVLAQITSAGKIPIPNSPLSQASSYLLDFANKAVEADIAAKNASDKFVTATLSLNIHPTGNSGGKPSGCVGFEETGVKAILLASGIGGPSLVPVGETASYCFTATTTPTFVISAAKKAPGKDSCDDPYYAPLQRAISNDFVGFFLISVPKEAVTKLGPLSVQERILKEETENAIQSGKDLCKALGVKRCPI